MKIDRVELGAFLDTSEAQRLFSRTREHRLRDLIAWAPISWLVELANPNPLPGTTMDNADGKGERRIALDELFDTMLELGMRDPLIRGIGKNRRVRLEEGNQRIRTFDEHVIRIPFAPVVARLGETAITNIANGPHEGLIMHSDPAFPLLPGLKVFARPDLHLPDAPFVPSLEMLPLCPEKLGGTLWVK